MKFKKSDLISGFIIIIGVYIGYTINKEPLNIDLSHKNTFSIQNISFSFSTMSFIFLRNMFVGILLSIGGYLTMGILTIIILFANGYFLGIYFSYFKHSSISILEFSYYFIFHGFIEMYALILFSRFGYDSLYRKNILDTNIIRQLVLNSQSLILPTTLLFIASIIETFLITNF